MLKFQYWSLKCWGTGLQRKPSDIQTTNEASQKQRTWGSRALVQCQVTSWGGGTRGFKQDSDEVTGVAGPPRRLAEWWLRGSEKPRLGGDNLKF